MKQQHHSYRRKPLPTPMWMQETAAWAVKLLLLVCFSIVALNIAAAVVDREQQLQHQQATEVVK